MVKEKNKENIYTWCCKKRKSQNCKGRATTKFTNGLHYLEKSTDHNHSPQASSGDVAKAVARIKRQAQETRDRPVQIIQNNIVNLSEKITPYMPSQNALRMRIKHIRRAEMPPEPQNINEIDIPTSLKTTLNGNLFLIKDLIVDQDRILLFTTKSNIEYLSQALFWVMDGTFKTVPTVFSQLYTIHTPIGGGENSRILPLVYSML